MSTSFWPIELIIVLLLLVILIIVCMYFYFNPMYILTLPTPTLLYHHNLSLLATVVAFIVANVTTVVDSANKHETVSSDRITEVTEFLREKNCSGSLMREIVAHYTQVFKNETQYDEEIILARLPPIVRNKVLLAEYKAIFETIPLFHYIPNVSLRVHLLRRMHAHVCHKGRQIIKEGRLMVIPPPPMVDVACVDGYTQAIICLYTS